MKKLTKIALIGAACLATAVIAWPAETPDPLDSLKICPDTQKLMFENQFVRVIDDEIPPGVREQMHHHRHGVVVYINGYKAEETRPGLDKPRFLERTQGQAAWGEEVTHTVKNIGQNKSHAIRIELKF